MKLDARQVAAFLRDPDTTRVALIYGEDEGLIRERTRVLTKRVAGSVDDPFLVTELTREGWGRIPAEFAALSMIGGRRVVIVRDATDATLQHVTEAIKTPGTAMLILEAAGLPKGKLRGFIEASRDGAAVACFAEEERAVASLIRSGLTELDVSCNDDALEWLAQNLEPGRSVVRAAVEKLALFAGPKGGVTLDMARICVGEHAAGAGEDGVMAALLGKWPEADQAVQAALADGLSGVGLMRMALALLQKLHQGALRVADGIPPNEAARLMRPPVFYRALPPMISALGLWSPDRLLACLEEARKVEIACKQTASLPDLLACRFVSDLARLARQQNTRRASRNVG